MSRRTLGFGVAILVVLAAVGVFLWQRPHGASASASRTAIVMVMKRMLKASRPAIPQSQLLQGKTPTAVESDRWTQREKTYLKTIYAPASPAYRQTLHAYQTALAQSGSYRRYHVRLVKFTVVTLTLNGNTASAEWQATLQESAARKTAGGWSTLTEKSVRMEGTTVFQEIKSGWRVTSTVQNVIGQS